VAGLERKVYALTKERDALRWAAWMRKGGVCCGLRACARQGVAVASWVGWKCSAQLCALHRRSAAACTYPAPSLCDADALPVLCPLRRGSEKLTGMDDLVREKDAIIKQASAWCRLRMSSCLQLCGPA